MSIQINVGSVKKTTKDGKRSWVEYFTKMRLLVKGFEESGKIEKYITIKFSDDAKSQIKSANFKRGLLVVDANNIIAPFKYEIKENPETGKKEYPFIYVKSIESLTAQEYTASQDAFVTVESDKMDLE